MFELLNDDLEECIELLRKISNETGTERWKLLAEMRVLNSQKDIEKTIELCELLCYYYEKVKD